jgi:hypothetical protein
MLFVAAYTGLGDVTGLLRCVQVEGETAPRGAASVFEALLLWAAQDRLSMHWVVL